MEWIRLVGARPLGRVDVGVEVDLKVVVQKRGMMMTVYELDDVDLVTLEVCMVLPRLDIYILCPCNSIRLVGCHR